MEGLISNIQTEQLSRYQPQQVSCQQTTELLKQCLIKKTQAISNTDIVFLIDCKSVLQSVQNESQDKFKHQ